MEKSAVINHRLKKEAWCTEESFTVTEVAGDLAVREESSWRALKATKVSLFLNSSVANDSNFQVN